MLAQQENIAQLVQLLETVCGQAASKGHKTDHQHKGCVVQELREQDAASDAERKQDR